MKRICLKITGHVQGVWFRQNTKIEATRLGLKGFARNLSDGGVEVVAEGDEKKLRELISFCCKGPEGARVDSVEKKFEEATGEFSDFSIRH